MLYDELFDVSHSQIELFKSNHYPLTRIESPEEHVINRWFPKGFEVPSRSSAAVLRFGRGSQSHSFRHCVFVCLWA